MLWPLIISLLTFLSVTLLVYSLKQVSLGSRAAVTERLKVYTSLPSAAEASASTSEEKEGRFTLRRLLKQVSRLLAPLAYSREVEKELLRADIPLRGEEFLVLVVFTTLLPPLAVWLLSPNPGLVLPLAAAGLFLPFLWLRLVKSHRIDRFNHQLADALSVLTSSLRAGYSFLQSVEMVSEESSPPLSDEFSLLVQEIKLGVTTEEGLLHLEERVPSSDLSLLVTAVLIQRQIGGNLAEVIDNIAHTIRERVRIQGEIKTLTAQGRISGIIVGILPVALLFIISGINYEYMNILFTHPWGRYMLGAGVVAELIGIMIIRRIVNIEV